MKKMGSMLAVVLVLALLALVWSFLPHRLPPWPGAAPRLPAPSQTVSLSVAETGSMDSQALFAYRGGSFEPRVFGMDVFVVRHPRGTILFEAGFGRHLAEHFRTVPWLMRAVSKVHAATPLADQLAAAGMAPSQIAGIYLTHAHWDHVGGLQDLPGVPVYVTRAERRFIDDGGDATVLIRSFGALDYRVYDFDGGPYAGYPSSHDVFGDGSVVIVPAAGHTPGAMIAFVRGAEHDYALIGDQAWQHEGVDIPAEKPWMSRVMVDDDAAGVRANLEHLHALQAANPRLVVVPSHDRRITAGLPRFAGQTASPP